MPEGDFFEEMSSPLGSSYRGSIVPQEAKSAAGYPCVPTFNYHLQNLTMHLGAQGPLWRKTYVPQFAGLSVGVFFRN